MLTTVLRPPTSIAELITNPPSTPPADNGSRIVDFPFIYVFDGTGLTAATAYNGLNVPITADANFYLRRIFGVPALVGATGKMQYRQPSGRRYQSDPEIFPIDYAISREIEFAADSSIRFDISTVSQLTKDSGNLKLGYIGWQGAKRMMLSAIPYDTPYAFKRLPVTHTLDLSLSWDYDDDNSARPQSLLIQNYDFELHCIRIVRTTLASIPGVENGTYNFAMLLYDAFGNKTSNLPVNNEWINELLVGASANLSSTTLAPVFPVPPLIYPRNSMIRFECQSWKTTGVTATYQIQFVGFDRYPLEA